VVGYGNTTSLRGEGLGSDRTGRRNRLHGIPLYAVYIAGGWLFPGPEADHPLQHSDAQASETSLFRHDLMALLELHYQHRIKPLIAHRFPLADARRAQELLAKGGFVGKIVLLRDAPSAAA
jgi:NADPH:quinone reductase